MLYKFFCQCCDNTIDLDIPINKYSELKGRQKCPFCKTKLNRVIEWTGVAIGNGQGWFGKSDGSKAV